MSTQNGGPAFPIGSGDLRDPVGMTLRDYFAAHAPVTLEDALIACCASHASLQMDDARAYIFQTLANLRLEYADAMLKARGE